MRIKFGVALPSCMEGLIYPAPFAAPQDLIKIAKVADHLGYDGVWPNDHMTTQKYVRRDWPDPPNYYEPLISLSFIAALTSKIKLATGVIVVPMRDIVPLAKQAATLDQLSGGRLILGLGIGAYREEFEAVRPGIKAQNRGEILDEGLMALKELLAQRRASFRGRFFNFKDVELYPKPRQQPLPIYIGGNAPAVVERAVRFGDGWFPAVLSPDEIKGRIEYMHQKAAQYGRDASSIDIAPQFIVSIAKDYDEALKKFRSSQAYRHIQSLTASTLKGQQAGGFEERNLIGSPSQIAARMEEFLRAGVTHFAGMMFAVNSVSEKLEAMEMFAKEVIPQFKK